ncbi:DUF4190 domain-containing protein [Marinoscillum furvescens]|uniref:DUF4190 domain-containing protein n=1 Tax=Marinoscillum furvescens DSM 4134 TaxID=1122208 RepID=A0A3D9L771_MARFU|nr:DUF4190 domain-containing protein [Marinoscillum furvescens]REE01509.1 hypothetical protein C7460_10325 [Marinoscillum furvescens DSM 4134]
MKRLPILLLAMLILGTACSPLRNCPDLSVSYEPAKPRLKQHKAALPSTSYTKPTTNPVQEALPLVASLETNPKQQQPAQFTSPALAPELPSFSKKEQKQFDRIKKKLSRNIPELPPVVADSLIITQEDITYEKARKLGRASLGLGIGSVAALLVPVLIFPLALASLITGSMSLKRYRKVTNKEGRGVALTGVIISSVWMALIILFVALLIILIASVNGGF